MLKSLIFSCTHCSCNIIALISHSLYTRIMLILILIDVQYSEKAVFNSEIASNCENHSYSGSHHLVKNFPTSKISDLPPPLSSPTLQRYLEDPALPQQILRSFCKHNSLLCSFCNFEDETVIHFLVHCSKTKRLWCTVIESFKINLHHYHHRVPSLAFLRLMIKCF